MLIEGFARLYSVSSVRVSEIILRYPAKADGTSFAGVSARWLGLTSQRIPNKPFISSRWMAKIG